MGETRRTAQSWIGAAVLVLLLILAALTLSGCGDPAAIAAVEPTATLYSPPPTDIPPPPPGPTPAPLDFPLPPPTDVKENEPMDAQTCVGCHTDEEILKAVAKQEEVPEVESEGEG